MIKKEDIDKNTELIENDFLISIVENRLSDKINSYLSHHKA